MKHLISLCEQDLIQCLLVSLERYQTCKKNIDLKTCHRGVSNLPNNRAVKIISIIMPIFVFSEYLLSDDILSLTQRSSRNLENVFKQKVSAGTM